MDNAWYGVECVVSPIRPHHRASPPIILPLCKRSAANAKKGKYVPKRLFIFLGTLPMAFVSISQNGNPHHKVGLKVWVYDSTVSV